MSAMWRPTSECSASCLDGAEARVGAVTTLVRLVRLFAVLVMGLILVLIVRRAAVRPLARGILAALGIRHTWRGATPRPGSLLVANHVSWLDIVALLAVGPVRLVAKREVGEWPGIGGVARTLGAIFVDRTRPRALPTTVGEVAASLRAGHSVAVFPEGTTFCGATRGKFRPAVFQAAADAGAPIVPISISYGTPAASFIGDETLWDSVRRIASLKDLSVSLVASPALRPVPGADRRVLARAAQATLMLAPLRSAGSRPEKAGVSAHRLQRPQTPRPLQPAH